MYAWRVLKCFDASSKASAAGVVSRVAAIAAVVFKVEGAISVRSKGRGGAGLRNLKIQEILEIDNLVKKFHEKFSFLKKKFILNHGANDIRRNPNAQNRQKMILLKNFNESINLCYTGFQLKKKHKKRETWETIDKNFPIKFFFRRKPPTTKYLAKMMKTTATQLIKNSRNVLQRQSRSATRQTCDHRIQHKHKQ